MRQRRRKSYHGWFKRTGQKVCAYCGVTLSTTGWRKMTADHVKPLSSGGYDKRKNVVACCARCNEAKGSMSIGEFMRLRAEGTSP